MTVPKAEYIALRDQAILLHRPQPSRPFLYFVDRLIGIWLYRLSLHCPNSSIIARTVHAQSLSRVVSTIGLAGTIFVVPRRYLDRVCGSSVCTSPRCIGSLPRRAREPRGDDRQGPDRYRLRDQAD